MKIFEFLSWLFGHVEKRFSFNFKRNKDKQAMKFNQLVEYNMKYRNILKLSCRPLLLPHIKLLQKQKKKAETRLPASFSVWFLNKNISLVVFYYLTKFYFLVVFASWDIGQYAYYNSLLIKWRLTNFKISFIFLIKPFFLYDQKVKIKSKYPENKKSF